MYIQTRMDIRGGERSGGFRLHSFRDAVRVPLLKVSQLIFALFC